ncbi:MAG: UDP-N-acetylenolpyruvoylglucosamine reductase [Bacteroidetes bacterium CG2_30_32_10]|nr:MAG: UDP-N-acetylenolpyruvoylglucosamine reductase [Bacteroidetes bacterium CG2_30_32_10]
MEIRKNISLKQYNTFGIDVNANVFVEVASLYDIKEFLTVYRTKFSSLPLLLLGGGSNMLFTKNFEGVVLKINTKGIDIIDENSENIFVKAYSGEVWETFVEYCIDKGWSGIENLSLIPGNVGSCPVQNIGAYGVEVKDVIFELEAINIHTGNVEIFQNKACNFDYRDSIFKKELKNQYIIYSVVFQLNKKPIFKTQYGAIEDELKAMSVTTPDIKSIGKAVSAIRRKKLPDTKEMGNAGSFFKNPNVSPVFFKELKLKFPKIIAYKLPDGRYKLAAGYLIEACDWKGKRVGECGVHEKQSLVLVNYGKASGKAIADLASNIQNSVFQKFHVNLETEVNIF